MIELSVKDEVLGNCSNMWEVGGEMRIYPLYISLLKINVYFNNGLDNGVVSMYSNCLAHAHFVNLALILNVIPDPKLIL